MFILLAIIPIVCVRGETFTTSDNKSIIHRIGYVGPACAVVDDALFLHGTYVRNLNDTEIGNFKEYQNNLTNFNKYYERYNLESSKKTQTYSAPTLIQIPVLPSFCEELDDSVEVVLNGCTVRDNRVFISGKLIRPLNNLERQKISAVIREQGQSMKRYKRETDNFAKLQNDMTALIHSLLNLNSTVAQRFLPVAKMSPMLSEVNTSLLDENHLSEAFNQVFQAERPKIAEELKKKMGNQDAEVEAATKSTTDSTTTIKSEASTSSSTEAAATIVLEFPTSTQPQTTESSTKKVSSKVALPETRKETTETTTVKWNTMLPWTTTHQPSTYQSQHSLGKPESQQHINGLQQLGSSLIGGKNLGYGNVANYQHQIPSHTVPSQLQNTWITNRITGYNQMLHPNSAAPTTPTLGLPLITFTPPKTLPHEICRAHIVDAFRLWSENDQFIQ